MTLTERKMRFVEHYTAGPTAGNGTASLRAAGYNPKDDNSAASMASRLLTEPEALQSDAIRVARQAITQLQVVGADGETAVDLTQISGPLVVLVKAGLEAAGVVEAYGLGKPLSRMEVGELGVFREQGLREALTEIRESMALLDAAGLAGLVLNPDTPADVEYEVVDEGY